MSRWPKEIRIGVSAIIDEMTRQVDGLPYRARHIDRGGMLCNEPYELERLERLERFGRAVGLEETHPDRTRDWANWERSDTACAYNAACAHLRAKGHSPEQGPHWGVTDDCHLDDPGNPRLGAASCADAHQVVLQFELLLLPLLERLAAVLPAELLPCLREVLGHADGIGVRSVLLTVRNAEASTRGSRQGGKTRGEQKTAEVAIRAGEPPETRLRVGERECARPGCNVWFSGHGNTKYCKKHRPKKSRKSRRKPSR